MRESWVCVVWCVKDMTNTESLIAILKPDNRMVDLYVAWTVRRDKDFFLLVEYAVAANSRDDAAWHGQVRPQGEKCYNSR